MNNIAKIFARPTAGAALAAVIAGASFIASGQAATAPNDPRFSAQWAPGAVRAPEAWDVVTGDGSIRVAILDSGINPLSDLDGKLVPGFNAISAGAPTVDDFSTYGSGTQIAGIIGAETNNGQDMAGVAWGAQLVPVKVCDRYGCTIDDLVEGVNWAKSNGVDIIHISPAFAASSPALDQAVADAVARGVVVIAASGNVLSRVGFPAALPGVIAVGATTSGGQVSSFSGRGETLDLVAPGESVLTLVSGGCCLTRTGTEHAAAHVTGAAVLLLAAGVAPSQVAGALTSGATDIAPAGWDAASGHGELDVCEALVRGWVACGGSGGSACADVTGDQQSDFSDVLVVLDHFGESGPALPWDIDADGQIQLSDALVLLGCFGY